MAIGSGNAIAEAFVRIRPTATGFEAELVKEITPAMRAADKNLTLKPRVDTSAATGPLSLLSTKLQSFAGRNPLTSALTDITTATGGAGGALSGLAGGPVAIAGAAITTFALGGVKDFTALADSVRSFSRVTLTAPEDASRFIDAFDKLGISGENATRAMGRFAKNATVNTDALTSMGIQIVKTNSGAVDVTKTFLNFADSVKGSADAGVRNAAVMKAFGREGLALLPILAQGREGVEKLFAEAADNEILSQADLDKAQEFKFSMHDLGDAFKGLQREAGQALVPFLTDVAEATTKGLEFVDKVLNAKVGGDSWLHQLATALNPLKGFNAETGNSAKELDKATHAADYHGRIVFNASKSVKGGADAQKDLAGATDEATLSIEDEGAKITAAAAAVTAHAAAIQTLTGASTDVTGAQRALAQANDQVTTASDKVGTATKKLNDLLAKGDVDARAVAAAHVTLERAILSVGTATEGVTDATNERADAERILTDLLSGKTATEEASKHAHDLEHAQLGVRGSTLSLTSAQDRLAELQNDATATAQDLEEAQLAVDNATLALTESQENLTTTQDDLNKVSQIGAENTTQTITARQTLEEKTRALTTAQQGLADAITAEATARLALTEAEKGANEAAVAQARKDITQAEIDLGNARFDAAGKAKELGEKQVALNDAMSGGLPDLREVKANLEKIIALQPQAAAFLQPTLDQINAVLTLATELAKAQILASYQPGRAPVLSGQRVPERAAGGSASGTFSVGERGRELVTLTPGGGAYVTPNHRVDASDMGGSGVHLTVEMTNHWGPGTGYDDVMRAMTDVANGAIAETLQRLVVKARAH